MSKHFTYLLHDTVTTQQQN